MPLSNSLVRLLWLAIIILAFAFCLVRVHHRVQTMLIGYDIGKLKEQESQLLKRQSLLNMELAKITTKQHLAKRINDAVPPEQQVH